MVGSTVVYLKSYSLASRSQINSCCIDDKEFWYFFHCYRLLKSLGEYDQIAARLKEELHRVDFFGLVPPR